MWESVAALGNYVHRSGHVEFLRRKREWFHRFGEAVLAMWWLPAGERTTLADAVAPLDHLRAYGPSERAFTFAHPWPAPDARFDASLPGTGDVRDVCPA